LCRENDEMSPYGTIENQKLLEKITLENIEKYCKKYKILKYHKDDIEWVINEILN
jgi:phage terminase small subunit